MRIWWILIPALLWPGCSGSWKERVVVVPESRVLAVGPRPGTHVIDDGYLREIMQALEACQK